MIFSCKILRAKNETEFAIMNKLIQFPRTSVNNHISSSSDAFQISLRLSQLYQMLRNIYFNFNNSIITTTMNANWIDSKCQCEHNDLNQHAHLSHAECVSVVQSNVTTLSHCVCVCVCVCESYGKSIRFCKTISTQFHWQFNRKLTVYSVHCIL